MITLLLLGQMGVPAINKHALIKDWAQWSLASASVLYAFHALRRRRNDLSP